MTIKLTLRRTLVLPVHYSVNKMQITENSFAIRQLIHQFIEVYLCQMRKKELRNIRTLALEEIEEYFEKMGEKKFRAKQVYEWRC